MSNTFLIGTGDIFLDELNGFEIICDDLSVCAMALSPSSKFIESNSNELVSTDIELEFEFEFSKSKYDLSNFSSSTWSLPNNEVSKAGSGKFDITNLVVDSVGTVVGMVVVVGWGLVLKVVVLTLLNIGLKGLAVGTNLLYLNVGVGLGG